MADRVKYILRFLGPSVTFNPALARFLGNDIHAALFLQQIIYWSDKGAREDGWIYKSDKELGEETLLSTRNCSRVRKKIRGMGFLDIKVMKVNGAPTNHYLLDEDKLAKCILDFYKTTESSITEITTKKNCVFLRKTPLPSEKKRKSSKTAQTERIAKYLCDRCISYTNNGQAPIITAKIYNMIRFALNTGGLTEQQVIQMIDDRFNEAPPDDKVLSVGWFFSAHNITQFKHRHEIKGQSRPSRLL